MLAVSGCGTVDCVGWNLLVGAFKISKFRGRNDISLILLVSNEITKIKYNLILRACSGRSGIRLEMEAYT